MIETVFRTEDVPAADRLAYWRELLSRTHAPMDLTSDNPEYFHACQRTLSFGAVSVWPVTFHAVTFHRTPKLIRQSDPDVYHLSLVLNGAATASWGDREISYGPYDLHYNSSSQPCTIWTGGPANVIKSVGVEVPKSLVPLPRRSANDVIGRPLSGRTGIGALLAGFLVRLTENTSGYQAGDEPRLGTVLADLVAALFAHTLEADRALPPETYRRTLLMRVQSFIRQHLHDPDLSRDSIATAHHISTSYLHRLFQENGETVMGWIRRQRLEHARRDLADPTQRMVPVHRIAARWGFVHHADFTRSFRTAFHTTPSEYRRETLRPTGTRVIHRVDRMGNGGH
ncbi:helix-turn-helix domain-containing protein [Actinokineospora iranica]|uniref:AraC-type DNA-binding protein n=1 Tax=Actinokineospora iranica TaxID=1271860 RepID=A0A1G6MBU8_9PSEU|nr:helix-turn-helix domain-containing protein [Actinokineospora iranica]SDC52983.1 AraC-type DNA-binding protein [Actinokineospora iranica]